MIDLADPKYSWMKPYAEAGHDVESVFSNGGGPCSRCGTWQIDLSEDLAYGDMRKCVEAVMDREWTGEELANAVTEAAKLYHGRNPILAIAKALIRARLKGE